MVSLFTSVYPINHGAVHGINNKKDRTTCTQEIFSPDLVTLAEVLKTQGYATFGVASSSHLDGKFGFGRGFDYFTCLPFLPAEAVNDAVFAREQEIRQAGRFFLWIHYFDPHAPYTPRKPWINEYALQARTELLLDMKGKSLDEMLCLFQDLNNEAVPAHLLPMRSQLEELMQNLNDKVINPEDHSLALYDSEINYVDSHIGTLMKRFNFGDDTLIVITADHGEEFLEHGQTGHGRNLYQQTIQVPLVVKLPNIAQRSVLEQPVSLIDVMPTILSIIQVDPPPTVPGKSCWYGNGLLWRLQEKLAGSDRGFRYAELDTKRSLKAILAPPWKYIYDCKDKTGQLFDTESDPMETHDLAGEQAGVGDPLREHLFHWMETSRQYPITHYDYEPSPEEKEKLKGLGYL
jgi:arylsulfatase A-like enzyme